MSLSLRNQWHLTARIMDYRTIYSWDSELSADSVEFCPIEGHRDILVVGTYFVSASDADTFSPSQRRGRIYLMELKHQGESERCVCAL